MNELYEAAHITRPILKEKVEKLVQQVCQSLSDDPDTVEIKLPELKGRERASRKAQDDYSGRVPGPGIAWLYDVLRCSILFQSADQVLKCIDILEQDETFHIVKVQNRFQIPALTGYRDLNFHIQLDGGGGFQHICEIQVHHRAIQCLDYTLMTHNYYEYFRSYFSGATGSLEERLNDLKLIGKGVAVVNESFLDDLLQQSEEEDRSRLRRLAKLFEEQLCEHEWALKVWERVLVLETLRNGEDYVFLSDVYYFVAGTLKQLGQVERALEFYQKAIDIRLENSGEDPIEGLEAYRYSLDWSFMQKGGVSLADIYNEMGLLLFEQQADLRGSILHFQRSLKIKKEHYKTSDHPSVTKTYANLAMVLRFN
ncbi:unnamed protein product [Cylindrotheca closterium]|uniref:Tetratricopeptide repeat protein n=1 Tax=Cylindrotheca closterium TaxID=2856 RepID=A0AAD2FQ63_9STRA|nr:unnamed protein product [Cylindrotheca closterium]